MTPFAALRVELSVREFHSAATVMGAREVEIEWGIYGKP
jgi:hypothetical protein